MPKAIPGPVPEISNTALPISRPPTLKSLGISRNLSSEAQRLAKLPAERFSAILADAELVRCLKELGKRQERRRRRERQTGRRDRDGETWYRKRTAFFQETFLAVTNSYRQALHQAVPFCYRQIPICCQS